MQLKQSLAMSVGEMPPGKSIRGAYVTMEDVAREAAG